MFNTCISKRTPRTDSNTSKGSRFQNLRGCKNKHHVVAARRNEGPSDDAVFKRCIRNEAGAFTVLGGFFVLAVISAGIGLSQVMKASRDATVDQLKLDRCTGGPALKITKILELVHDSNKRKTAYLSASAAVVVAPALSGIIRAGLTAESTFQNFLEACWKIESTLWTLHLVKDCPLILISQLSPFPNFPFSPGLETPLGTGPSLFTSLNPARLTAQLGSRKSTAEIINPENSARLKAAWIQ